MSEQKKRYINEKRALVQLPKEQMTIDELTAEIREGSTLSGNGHQTLGKVSLTEVVPKPTAE